MPDPETNRQATHNKAKFAYWMVVDIFRLTRDGLTMSAVADHLDVSLISLGNWKRDKPCVAHAFTEGEFWRNNKESEFALTDNFVDYCLNMLPAEERALWETVDMWADEPDAFERTRSLLRDKGKKTHQMLYVHAFISLNYDCNKAAERVCVPLKTFRAWQTDPDFQMMMDAVNAHRKNFCEAALMGLVKGGHPQAIMFANKTLNADRGFAEKAIIQHQGDVNHHHDAIPFDELELSPACLREIRQAQAAWQKKRIGSSGGEIIDAEIISPKQLTATH